MYLFFDTISLWAKLDNDRHSKWYLVCSHQRASPQIHESSGVAAICGTCFRYTAFKKIDSKENSKKYRGIYEVQKSMQSRQSLGKVVSTLRVFKSQKGTEPGIDMPDPF